MSHEFPFCVDLRFSEHIRRVLALNDQIRELAQELYDKRSLLVMGRGYNFATCLEGALVSGRGALCQRERERFSKFESCLFNRQNLRSYYSFYTLEMRCLIVN